MHSEHTSFFSPEKKKELQKKEYMKKRKYKKIKYEKKNNPKKKVCKKKKKSQKLRILLFVACKTIKIISATWWGLFFFF